MGIKGALLNWLQSFLIGRRHRVSVDGHLSDWGQVISGVPQGTVLGPILFLAHVLDIDVNVDSQVSCFADDTRIVRAVPNLNEATLLQEDLNKVYSWASNNNMSFNNEKFRVLHYRCAGGDSDDRHYHSPDGKEIESATEIKDICVIMSNTGNFNSQVDEAVRKAKRCMGWLLRTFITGDPNHLLILYKAIVLPHLEYYCQVRNPIKLGNIRKLECVQRTFTARINGLKEQNYWERLKSLSLYSLERRRERFLGIYMWKMQAGLVPTVLRDGTLDVRAVKGGRRGRRLAIPWINNRAPMPTQNLLEQSLPINGARIYNALPKSLREYNGSLLGFKTRLDEYLQTVPDKPYLSQYSLSVWSNSLSMLP